MRYPSSSSLIVSIALLSQPLPAKAADCFHGDTERFVRVEICRDNPTGCLAICIARNAWDTPEGEATLIRHIVAVADGALSFDDVADAFPQGIGPSSKEPIANVTVYTETLFEQNGKVY